MLSLYRAGVKSFRKAGPFFFEGQERARVWIEIVDRKPVGL